YSVSDGIVGFSASTLASVWSASTSVSESAVLPASSCSRCARAADLVITFT
ncbi:hypothetical protein CSUI_007140, partial [Cystoisospora suis]